MCPLVVSSGGVSGVSFDENDESLWVWIGVLRKMSNILGKSLFFRKITVLVTFHEPLGLDRGLWCQNHEKVSKKGRKSVQNAVDRKVQKMVQNAVDRKVQMRPREAQ